MFRTDRAALFTIVQDDPVFLRLWVDYYCDRHFPPHDIYVLDHGCTGDCQRVLMDAENQHGFNVIPVEHDYSFDAWWLTGLARSFQKFLLASYRHVAFTATDELLMSPGTPGEPLSDRLRRHRTSYCLGWEVVHKRDDEPALDFNARPLLSQRRWWYTARRYTKPAVASYPTLWQPGFTTAANVPLRPPITAFDESVLLVHIHRIDFDACLVRHRERASRRWRPVARQPPADRGEPNYRHNLLEDPEQLERWMLCNADNTGQFAALTEIPESVRSAF